MLDSRTNQRTAGGRSTGITYVDGTRSQLRNQHFGKLGQIRAREIWPKVKRKVMEPLLVNGLRVVLMQANSGYVVVLINVQLALCVDRLGPTSGTATS